MLLVFKMNDCLGYQVHVYQLRLFYNILYPHPSKKSGVADIYSLLRFSNPVYP